MQRRSEYKQKRRVGNRHPLRCNGGVIVRKKSLRVLLCKTQLPLGKGAFKCFYQNLSGGLKCLPLTREVAKPQVLTEGENYKCAFGTSASAVPYGALTTQPQLVGFGVYDEP